MSFLVAGSLIAALGLLVVLWAAAPVLAAAGSVMADAVGTLFDQHVPAWVGKLLLAAVLLAIGGAFVMLGVLRWGFAAVTDWRRNRFGGQEFSSATSVARSSTAGATNPGSHPAPAPAASAPAASAFDGGSGPEHP